MFRFTLIAALALAGCATPGAMDPNAEDLVDVDAGSGGEGTERQDAGEEPPTGPRFSEVSLAATHNSYSGDIVGERGSILAQLELGIRMFEFDFHDNDFASEGYRVGHDRPGHEVDHSGTNPEGDRLEDWLGIVAAFSEENPEHAPIVITLDAKDDLTDNADRASGNLGELGAIMEAVFGESLVRAADIEGGAWPVADTLRGRVMVVLSGHHGSRLLYRRVEGENPAIAINESGQVIAAHDDGSGTLISWTGVIEDGFIRWQRRTRYDTGTDPAIALADDGRVVEVHEAPGAGDHTLFYRLGQLDSDGVIRWTQAAGQRFPNSDSGVDPSVKFVGGAGLSVREVHLSQSSGNPFYWNGTLDFAEGRVVWTRNGDNGSTTDPRFEEHRSASSSHTVEIQQGPLGSYGPDTLGVRVDAGERVVVRYPQTLFVDAQPNSSAELREDEGIEFFTAPADESSGRTWGGEQRANGGLVRLYDFEEPEHASTPAPNYAATDHPFAPWHAEYCQVQGCLDWD